MNLAQLRELISENNRHYKSLGEADSVIPRIGKPRQSIHKFLVNHSDLAAQLIRYLIHRYDEEFFGLDSAAIRNEAILNTIAIDYPELAYEAGKIMGVATVGEAMTKLMGGLKQ